MLMQSKMRPKGLFGAFSPGMQDMTPQTIPGAEMGLGMANMVNSPAPMQQPKKPGLNWGGILADFLAGMAGQQGPYAASMMARREAEAKARAQQDQRDYEWSKWLKQKEWERDNPAPVNNDTINDYNWVLQTYGKEAADQYGQGVYDPIVNVQLPGGAVYSGPRSGLQSALGNAQQAPQQPQGQLKPVGKLRPVGGAGGNTSGNFPRR